MYSNDQDNQEFKEKIVTINRVAKVVKGGRRFSFSALVVVGDMNGRVGYGHGKANEVPEAIAKGGERAKATMIDVPIFNDTIPHDVIGHFGAGRVLLKPARKGTGVIAGGAVRTLVEAAGIKNILAKCLNTSNPHNVIRATMDGLRQLRESQEKRRHLQKTVKQEK